MRRDRTVTLGIDLAAQDSRTAACEIAWSDGGGTVTLIDLGISDDFVVGGAARAGKVAIDAPLGWPVAFVGALIEFASSGNWPTASKRELMFRATDCHVREVAGIWPLSVSSQPIAVTAMRAAALTTRLRMAGHAVDRVGSGLVVEAYPAAALARWSMPPRGYKKKEETDARRTLLRRITAALPALKMSRLQSALCVECDDALDALVCSLVARAADLGLTESPPEASQAAAAAEGWIALPLRDSLSHLFGTA